MKFDLTEYIKAVILYGDYYCLRSGQAFFNVLHRDYPELAEEIRGTELDPFYDSGKNDKFIEWLKEK